MWRLDKHLNSINILQKFILKIKRNCNLNKGGLRYRLPNLYLTLICSFHTKKLYLNIIPC